MNALCVVDADCAVMNSRCYNTIPLDRMPPDALPSMNSSIRCYCDQWFMWAGPNCDGISSTTIGLAVSCILCGTIAFILGCCALRDSYLLIDHALDEVPSPPPSSQVRRRPSNMHFRGRSRPGDVQIVTCALLSLALLALTGWMIVDAISTLERRTCGSSTKNKQGQAYRTTCYVTANNVFLISAPIIGTPLILLLSVLVFNASYRANGLSTLPLSSFCFLILLEAVLLATLIAASVVMDYAIASYSGAVFALITGIINFMSCWRLRDFSAFKLRNTSKSGVLESAHWTIRQRLMVISAEAFVLNMTACAALLVRAIYSDSRSEVAILGRYSQIAEHIFRWTYLGTLAVYFSLIHYNTQKRLHVNPSPGQSENVPVSSVAPPQDQHVENSQVWTNDSTGNPRNKEPEESDSKVHAAPGNLSVTQT